MEELGSCMHVTEQWLGRGITAEEVVEFGRGNSRGVKKLHCTAAVATKRTEMTTMTKERQFVK